MACLFVSCAAPEQKISEATNIKESEPVQEGNGFALEKVKLSQDDNDEPDITKGYSNPLSVLTITEFHGNYKAIAHNGYFSVKNNCLFYYNEPSELVKKEGQVTKRLTPVFVSKKIDISDLPNSFTYSNSKTNMNEMKTIGGPILQNLDILDIIDRPAEICVVSPFIVVMSY